MKASKSDSLHRTTPLKETLTQLGNGYPNKLVIFQIAASPYWWCRYYSQGKILKKSTKTTDKREAKEIAKRFYEDILLKERQSKSLDSDSSFERIAEELLKEQQLLIFRGERNPFDF